MPSTFKTNDTEVSKILNQIANRQSQLPDFQRGWVWDDNRIKALIASISNSFPVGALMFLEYGGDTVRFKHRTFTGVADNGEAPEILVLDGQQRLTSMFCSMYCREAVPTQTEKNKPINRFYYLDMQKCLDKAIDREDAILSIHEDKIIRSDFGRHIDLDLSTAENEYINHMFPLNIVFDYGACSDWRNAYQKHHSYDSSVMQLYTEFETSVLRVIQEYKVPVITLDKGTPKEAVCQVFENVNTGGVSLTVFELVTATYAAENFELRKDWEKRYSKFVAKSALTPDDASSAVLSVVSATDFLTATTLYSRYLSHQSGGDAVSCKRKDVLKLSYSDYTNNADVVAEGFLDAARFLKEQRIFSARDLPYSTQLIPMAVIFALMGKKSQDGTVKDKISRWYWCGILGEMYGGANETRYSNDVAGVLSWIEEGKVEPDTVSRAFFNPTRLLSLQTRQSAAYKGIMALVLQSGAQDFISGSQMDFTVFLDENTDIHHIFPKAYCEKNVIEKVKWNSIVNKTPLFARTNRIIGGKAPSEYLKQIAKDNHVGLVQLDGFVGSHKIDVPSMRGDKFDTFFIERAKSLLTLIGAAMGKPVGERDSADIISVFGASLAE